MASTTKHPSHKTRHSDSSLYDEVCVRCGATDIIGGGWGPLADPCPQEHSEDEPWAIPPKRKATLMTDAERAAKQRLTDYLLSGRPSKLRDADIGVALALIDRLTSPSQGSREIAERIKGAVGQAILDGDSAALDAGITDALTALSAEKDAEKAKYIAAMHENAGIAKGLSDDLTAMGVRAQHAEALLEKAREGLEIAEAAMSIVEPRSDKRKYLDALASVRAILSEITKGYPPTERALTQRSEGDTDGIKSV